MDDKSWRILQTLQADARSPLKALADAAGLSLPATAERLRKLEESGVITGYRAEVDAAALGHGIEAVVGITVAQPSKKKFLDSLQRNAAVLECLHVTGADSYLLRVVAQDMADFERLIGSINAWGETRSSIVMSVPLPRRGPQRV